MKQLNWAILTLGLLLATVAGCNQPVCLPDYDEIYRRSGLPQDLASNPDLTKAPTAPTVPVPPDINQPESPPRPMTLHEAIARALENGTTGLQTQLNLGLSDDSLVTIGSVGAYTYFGDSIRVLALNPAISQTNIEANLARYDVIFQAIGGFTSIDNPTDSANAIRNGQFTVLGASLQKALPTGGLFGVTLGSETNQGLSPATDFYSHFASSNVTTGTLIPQYTPQLRFDFQQPLLRFFGSDVEDLLAFHPLSSASNFLSNSPENNQNGILISRILFDQNRIEFERQLNFMLVNVELAYWNLYGSYIQLYASEQALRQALVTWKINKLKFDAGSLKLAQISLVEGQYFSFASKRNTALNNVLQAERNLRSLIGMPVADGTRIVPVDTPSVDEYIPDWQSAYRDCLALRPELSLQRNDVKQKQLEILREANSILPDLRFIADYIVGGAGTRLDGDATLPNGLDANAMRSLTSDHYDSYSFGLSLNIPIGYRAQYAGLRAAKLRLTQSFLQLRDQEDRAVRFLTDQYRLVILNYKLIASNRASRIAYANEVEARFKEFLANTTTAEFLLQAQQDWANALQAEYQSIIDYNNALAKFHFAKGTLRQHDGIDIAEGALPQCAQVRAVENERERAHALVLREHETRVQQKPIDSQGGCAVPVFPSVGAVSLPGLSMDQKDRVPEVPLDQLRPSSLPSGEPTMPGGPVSSRPQASLGLAYQASIAPPMPSMPSAPPAARDVIPAATPPPPLGQVTQNDGLGGLVASPADAAGRASLPR
jgi:outer membrane protein TolC